MIIVVANSKGGVGKSTLAVHLAAWLAGRGHSVTFADCDAQQSSSPWVAEALPDVKLVRLETSNDILNELPALGAEADFVVADGPGSDSDRGRSLLFRADLAVVPCKASMLEVRALAAATETLRQVYADAPGQGAVVSQLGSRGREAATEVELLFRELLPEAAGGAKATTASRGPRTRLATIKTTNG